MSDIRTAPAFDAAPDQLPLGAPVSYVRGDREGLFAGIPKDRIDEWREFHRANPWVWVHFRKYAHELRVAGVKRAGARMIIERVRWDVEKKDIRVDSGFLINNNYVALYARLLALREPQFFRDFFEFREMKQGENV